jgi:hypothetical protein
MELVGEIFIRPGRYDYYLVAATNRLFGVGNRQGLRFAAEEEPAFSVSRSKKCVIVEFVLNVKIGTGASVRSDD